MTLGEASRSAARGDVGGFGGDPLVEGHVLAAQPNAQRARHPVGLELPASVARGSVSPLALQSVGRGAGILGGFHEPAVLQRSMPEHPESGRQVVAVKAVLFPPDGIPQVLFQVRHVGFGHDLVQTRPRFLGGRGATRREGHQR